MDDNKKNTELSDNVPVPVDGVAETPIESLPANDGGTQSVTAVDGGNLPAGTAEYKEYYSEQSPDESMRGGYASVKGKPVGRYENKTVWIVLAVMVVMCIAVGICSSVLTGHFMRKGEKPPVINTGNDVQQNITAVVTARKSSIAEVRCGGLTASGIVMKREGENITVLTNAHAIAQYVNGGILPAVRFYGEDGYFQADVVGYDGHYDVAVLNVVHDTVYTVYDLDGSKYFSPDLEYSEGDYVVSIGNAMGMGIAAYDGIISKKSELLECDELFGADGKKHVPVVRPTAVINAGMSGGGVFDMQGNLVGLGTYRMSNSVGVDKDGGATTDVEDTGFAVPVSVLYPIYKRILAENSGGATALARVTAKPSNTSAVGWLGLPFGFNCEYRLGKLTVVSLDQASPSKNVEEGDIITKIGAIEIGDDICRAIGAILCYKPRGLGNILRITLLRTGGESYAVNIDGYNYAV